MRYLFAREVDEKKLELSGAETLFCSAEAPQSMKDDLRREAEIVRDTVQRLLPRGFSVIKTASLVITLLILSGIIRALGNVTIVQEYHNAPYLFWISGTSAVIWLACLIYEAVQKKRLGNNRKFGASYERAAENIKNYLGIPLETETADILSFSYRMQGSGMRFQGAAACQNVELWREQNCLNLFDGSSVYTLPLQDAEIQMLNLKVPMDGSWNKDESPDSRKYQNAGVKTVYSLPQELRFCCALDLTANGERCRLLFPAYELRVFRELTGLNATRLPKRRKDKVEAMAPADDFSLSSEKVRPLYYWRLPKEEAGFWFSPASDVEFKAAHPVIYVLLLLIGLFVLLAPPLIFGFSATHIPGNQNNAWIFLGVIGGLVTGVGLFNLVAAWMHQYLGHVFTIICLLAGGVLMAMTWFFLL